jgi:hypothetical protein
MGEDWNKFLPLSPATLHILVSLAGGDLHGYGIMQEVRRQSGGRYRIGPGTLGTSSAMALDWRNQTSGFATRLRVPHLRS